MKKILVPLADGFEEIEAVTVIDVLRRVNLEVSVAGVKEGPIKGRSGLVVTPEVTLDEVMGSSQFDMIVLPGGQPASNTLRDDRRVMRLLKEMEDKGAYVAAICAAPLALNAAGLLEGKEFTCYPGVEKNLPVQGFSAQRVVKSGKLVTSRGPGTAMEFAIELVRELCGDDAADTVAKQVVAG